jgi:hypothetical protein
MGDPFGPARKLLIENSVGLSIAAVVIVFGLVTGNTRGAVTLGFVLKVLAFGGAVAFFCWGFVVILGDWIGPRTVRTIAKVVLMATMVLIALILIVTDRH